MPRASPSCEDVTLDRFRLTFCGATVVGRLLHETKQVAKVESYAQVTRFRSSRANALGLASPTGSAVEAAHARNLRQIGLFASISVHFSGAVFFFFVVVVALRATVTFGRVMRNYPACKPRGDNIRKLV